MRGCLFTLILAAVVVALIVVVGLPAVAAGLLTAGVKAAGLQAEDTTVTVTADPPWDLVSLNADRVRVRATTATFRGLKIGALDVTFTDVAILDRSAKSVAGRLTGVTVPNVAGQPLGLQSISVAGGGDAVTATTTIAALDAQSLIAAEVSSATGVSIPATAVRLAAPNKVVVKSVVTVTATLGVNNSGDLVANAKGLDPIVMLRAGEDVPLKFTSVSVDGSGNLVLAGTFAVGLLGS
ncbi:MAG: hypothetical protein U0838_02315 [Chloroflexota bacterium]